VLAAGGVGFQFWWNDHQIAERAAAVSAPVPSELRTSSHPSTAGATTPKVGAGSVATATHQSPIVPSHLFIPAIGVNTTVAAKPSSTQWDEFLGKDVESFGVPADMYTTTWWNANAEGLQEPRPGDPGMAIILGHTQVGAYGVFNKLGGLQPGQVAGVSDGHTTLKFEVVAVKRAIPKNDGAALADVLRSHPDNARLALITCSGDFNGRESVNNTVVFLRAVTDA
jgi:LPXTG-site transpeptidase (sortase) family protein